jgi:CubicO group peptidase (beta-lactamase class C family)/predicted neuraminidase
MWSPRWWVVALLVVIFARPAARAEEPPGKTDRKGALAMPRATPESRGVSSAAIRAFVEAADKHITTMHSFMLVRHGRVVAEGWWRPQSADTRHVMWSLSKSFTSTAVGLAVAEGKLRLDDPVLKFFPDLAPEEPSVNLKAMRVRDLLAMSTGHQTEPRFTKDTPWVKTFLAHPVPHRPGTHFLYNTPATYVCSAIVQKVTGQTVLEYLKPRLFEPLGIEGPIWGTSPQGVTLGGFGLFIRTEDVARFGQLYLRKGKWAGKQLVPASWVAQATRRQASNGSNPDSDWEQGYGFQFWRSRHGAYRGDGARGQFCIVLPAQDAVVAITADTNDMQGQLNLVWDKLLPGLRDKALPEDKAEQEKLRQALAGLKARSKPAGKPADAAAAGPLHEAELVFPLHPKHNHAPGIVECPNGDLLVSWYRGSGERSADDVAVYGARKKGGSDRWGDTFLMADTPGFPDCNTAMFIDARGRLWLFWPLILANSWESCLTRYRVSSEYQRDGAPKWEWQGIIPLKPKDFEEVLVREFAVWKKQVAGLSKRPRLTEDLVKRRASDKLLSRLGWQPRCKPTVLRAGRILLPLYSDTYSAGLMAISDDGGKTWTASRPLAGFGSIQPAVVERKDGTLVAYMRENGPLKKVRVSESKDRGVTWGSVGTIDLPNPGSGLDALQLTSGNWLLIYNDTRKGRSSLAVSLSADEGATWKWTRHLEKHESGAYHYPAVIQARDGSIHAVYSYFVKGGKSMNHARFNEAWVKQGD